MQQRHIPVRHVLPRGNRKDGSTGQYQLGGRTYDPGKAGFLTPDSYRSGSAAQNLGIGVDPLTRNTYGYVNGDPINYMDPSGHAQIEGSTGGVTCPKTDCQGYVRRYLRLSEIYEKNHAAIIRRLYITRNNECGKRCDSQIYALMWLATQPQVLSFDPEANHGYGNAAIVSGDLAGAPNLAVLVPGLNTNLNNFKGIVGNAERLRNNDPAVAAVAWTGYDVPQLSLDDVNSDVAHEERAETGGRKLINFMTHLRELRPADGGGKTSVFGHSYGSVVLGKALNRRYPLKVDNAIFLGSPGTGANSVAEFPAAGTYYAGASRNDLVNREFGTFGANPTDPSFGTYSIPTADLTGHSEYYKSGTSSLYYLQSIAADRVQWHYPQNSNGMAGAPS